MHPDQADAITTQNAQAIAGHVTGTQPIDTQALLQHLKTAAPPVPPPPLPSALQTDAQSRASAPKWRNPRTGATSPMVAPGQERGPLSVLDTPLTGGSNAVEGVEQMSRPTLREKAGGLHKTIGGVFEAATPLMAGAGAAAPIATAATLATTMAAQTTAEAALKKIGLPEEYAAVAGDLVGLFAGAKTAKTVDALRAKYEPILKARFAKATPKPETPAPVQYTSTGQPIGGVRAPEAETKPPVIKTKTPKAAPVAPLIETKAATPETKTVDPRKRLRGEKYSAWQERIKEPDQAPAVPPGWNVVASEPEKEKPHETKTTVAPAGEKAEPAKPAPELTASGGKPAAEETEVEKPEPVTTAIRARMIRDAADQKPPDQKPPVTPSGTGTEKIPQKEISGSSAAAPTVESSHAGSAASAEAQSEQPAGEGKEVPEPRRPGHPVTSGAETEVYAEGRDEPYKARYAVRELSDTYPSHNPFSFEPNPDFHYINDRDYSLPANRQRVVTASGSRFRPVKVINTNPDAINGPSIIDRYGNVLGGNNRRMALERVYSLNPKGAAEYRATLVAKAAHFGLYPAELAKYKQPILVREIDESELDPQHAMSTEKSLFGEPDPADAFAASFGDRSDPRSGAVSPELLALGIPTFIREDVAPVLRNVATGIRDTYDDIAKMLWPSLVDRSSKLASLIIRGHIGELARRTDQAEHSVRTARKYFNRQPAADNFDFINRMETGQKQKSPYLDTVAKLLRDLYNDRRDMVQALGTGKLRNFYENYFAHIWAKPERAKTVMQAFFGKRPLEGGKSFLKKRTYPTIADGLAAGLKPLTDNPVTMTLLKIREMDKYVAGHRILKDPAMAARYVDARDGKAPFGYRQLQDPIGTVYGQSIQQISEFPNEGLWTGLHKVADALGIKHDRGFLSLGEAVGRADKAGGGIKTLHGSAEDVVAHEIGHQIDWLAGSGKRFVLEYPDAATVGRLKRAYATLKDKASAPADRTAARVDLKNLKGAIAQRKEFQKQLRDLADLRGGRKEYTRKREEKMAQLAEMWVGSRELFERTAPKVYAEWKKFLDENPKLHALRDIEGNTEVTAIAQPYDVGGLVIKGHWYLPDGAARMVDNYLSPGLSRYAPFRAAMGLNNVMNLFNLGLSGFHLTKTAFEATISKGSIGLEQIARGHPIEGARNLVAAPAAPFTAWVSGSKYLKEWYTPGSQGSVIGKIMNDLTSGGARARLDQMYRTTIAENMVKAMSQGNLPGAAIRAPFAGMEALTRLIMDEVVPRMKMGTMADMAAADLARLGPNAAYADVQRVMAETVNSVDNRMGEVARDNFFTHRYVKDLSMFMMRADQYFLGTVREIGGAAVDVVRQPINAMRGEPVNLKRLSYIGSMLMFHMAYAALYQYLHTGKWPEEGEDYFYPKNGQTDEHGHAERTSLMSYVKDVHSFARHPVTTLENKVAPAITLFSELLRNSDFWHVQIQNPDDSPLARAGEVGKFVAKQFEPRSIENALRQKNLGASPGQQAEQFVGLSPANADLDQSPAERMAHELASHGDETRTPEAAERSTLRSSLTRSLQNHKGVPADVKAAQQAGKFSRQDIEMAVRASRESPIERSFLSLSIDDAVKVYSASTATEKKLLQPMFMRKFRAALAREAPADRAKTLADVKAALAGR